MDTSRYRVWILQDNNVEPDLLDKLKEKKIYMWTGYL